MMESSKEKYKIEPCPLCGSEYPWKWICADTVVLECDCGCALKKASAKTLYKIEDLPQELIKHSYEQNGLAFRQSDGSTKLASELGYVAVSIPAALHHAGVAKIWNNRVKHK